MLLKLKIFERKTKICCKKFKNFNQISTTVVRKKFLNVLILKISCSVVKTCLYGSLQLFKINKKSSIIKNFKICQNMHFKLILYIFQP